MERPDPQNNTIRGYNTVNEGEICRINTYFSKISYFSTVKYGKYGSKTQYDVFNTNAVLIRIRINTAGPALHMLVTRSEQVGPLIPQLIACMHQSTKQRETLRYIKKRWQQTQDVYCITSLLAKAFLFHPLSIVSTLSIHFLIAFHK